jgi:hypothetical protein
MTDTETNIWNAMLDAEYNVKVIDRLGKNYYKYDNILTLFEWPLPSINEAGPAPSR